MRKVKREENQRSTLSQSGEDDDAVGIPTLWPLGYTSPAASALYKPAQSALPQANCIETIMLLTEWDWRRIY